MYLRKLHLYAKCNQILSILKYLSVSLEKCIQNNK